MIAHTVTEKDILSHVVDCYGYFVLHNTLSAESLPDDLKKFQEMYYGDLHSWLMASKFSGKSLEARVLPLMKDGKLVHAVFVGLGDLEDEVLNIEQYRRAVGKLIRVAIQQSAQSLAFKLPADELFDFNAHYVARQTATIALMTNYHFNEFITAQENKSIALYDMVIGVASEHKEEIVVGFKDGFCIGHAVNKARHWIDLPPSDLTPPQLSFKATEIAQKTGLGITVFSEKEINKMGMGGLGGVSRGSDLDCQLVLMEYKTQRTDAQTIVFVGKGITFDSGGLSLKPAGSMESMKHDMSGAAAVIAAMEAIAELKPEVNVIAVAALAENLPSGKALMPGDIVRFYNGKTAEIKNTDAEGRLILADALSYAVKHYNPDAIIDLATLTGACPIALGPFFSALMSQHEELIDIIQEAAQLSGDRVWELPLDDDFKPSIKSTVADMANTTERKYGAQAVCAAFFLKNFVGDTPWAHLDIAGTSFDVPDLPYYRPGATGVGVRLLVEIAMNWHYDENE